MGLKFSILIPSFNSGEYIGATIRSLLNQNYVDFEIVIHDGGSSDGTVQVVRSFTDDRIKFVQQRDAGQLDALISASLLATGDILYWLNADDILMPGSLSHVAEIFEKNPDIDLVYSDDYAFNESELSLSVGSTIRNLSYHQHLLFYRQLYSECVFWRRGVVSAIDHRSFDLRVYTDYAFFLGFPANLQRRWTDKRLGAFRVRDGQNSQGYADRKQLEFHRVRAEARNRLSMGGLETATKAAILAPGFLVCQILYPALERSVRRIVRLATRDFKRARQQSAFYAQWLPGRTKETTQLISQLWR